MPVWTRHPCGAWRAPPPGAPRQEAGRATDRIHERRALSPPQPQGAPERARSPRVSDTASGGKGQAVRSIPAGSVHNGGIASLATIASGNARDRRSSAASAGSDSSRNSTMTRPPGSVARTSRSRASSAMRSPVRRYVIDVVLRKRSCNRSGARNAAPIAVDPDPYGYASVVTRAPSAWQRPTSAGTRSMCRARRRVDVAVVHVGPVVPAAQTTSSAPLINVSGANSTMSRECVNVGTPAAAASSATARYSAGSTPGCVPDEHSDTDGAGGEVGRHLVEDPPYLGRGRSPLPFGAGQPAEDRRRTPIERPVRDHVHAPGRPGRREAVVDRGTCCASGIGDLHRRGWAPSRSSAVVTPSHAWSRRPGSVCAWLWRSTKPGATTRPPTSTVVAPSRLSPTAVTESPSIPTSPTRSNPVSGSTTRPPASTKSCDTSQPPPTAPAA